MGDTFLRYMPSRRFVAIALPLVIGFGVSFGLVAWSAVKTVEHEQDRAELLASAGASLDLLASEDDDNDGLDNWEESLWGTDPDNPDTDADGTRDGDEVVRNRNPLIPWPDDVLNPSTEKITGESQIFELYDATTTEKFAQNFFSSYLHLKQSGTLDSVSRDQLIGSLLNQVPVGGMVTTYETTDVTLSSENNRESLKRYRDAYIPIVQEAFRIRVSELAMAKMALEGTDDGIFNELAQAAEVYSLIIDQLLALEVPEMVAQEHLAILNGMAKFEYVASSLSVAREEPLGAMVGIKMIITAQEQTNAAVRRLATTFSGFDMPFDSILEFSS